MSPLVRLENLQQFAAVNLLRDPGAIPGPKVVPSVAQIMLVFNLESAKLGRVVLNGRYSGSFSGSPAQATAIWTALTTGAQWTALAAFFSTSNLLGAVQLRDINTANQPLITSTGAGAPGTSASPSLPNEVAAVVTLRTAFTGQSMRGRSYIPGWATNSLGAGNVIASAAVTALQNWANTWMGLLAAQGYTLVIAQPARQQYTGSTGRVHPARTATSTTVSALVVRDNHWDTQRRRGLK